jgi:HD superfamily phosphohydrolase
MESLSSTYQKFKTLNDPVYGFVHIPEGILSDLMEHPWMQRLRRISQTALTYLVYPGATHTRFHHALGATHITRQAISVLRQKGHDVSAEEEEGVLIAIMLHDIGHGPFSHTLEHTLINVHHEDISLLFMHALNQQHGGKLDRAISIFNNTYHKPFLHQLVSSQLDMDRLDYLRRDSFFTGVSEGMVNTERLISMLNVANGQLVVDAKAVYSIEKFLVARRLMYWQVYLHKTVLSAEYLLVRILERARFLREAGSEVPCSNALHYVLDHRLSVEELAGKLDLYARLDDVDILSAIKGWMYHNDEVLAELSRRLIDRDLLKVRLREQPFSKEEVDAYKNRAKKALGLSDESLSYFVFSGAIENRAYNTETASISLLESNGTITPIANDAHIMDIQAFSRTFRQYYLCYPYSRGK